MGRGAIPLLTTALVPLIVFTLAQTQTFAETARPYASGTIFLFLGGFFLAAAVQKWNLHRRIALNVVKVVGTKPKMIVLGFMIATGFITMWVSNTATAIMMLPIGLSVLHLIDGGKKGSELLHSNFAKALMLGIAYSASIVATSSLISTPPNALLRAYMLDNYGITLTFGRWLVFAAPMAWIFLLIAWHLLVNVFFIQSTMMSLITSIVVVLLFAGITAYETQQIKEMYYEGDTPGVAKGKSIFGAFMLYGSFITLFIHILNILGIMRSE